MTLFHCPYCGEDRDILQGLSRTRLYPLKERVYVILCDGKSNRRPHPPTIFVMEVLSAYDGQHIKLASVTAFQVEVKRGVWDPYRLYMNLRGGAKVVREGPPKKNKDDPNIAPFKCLKCGRKGIRNFKASTMTGRRPSAWTIAYECDNHDRMPITFFVRRIVVSRQGKTSNFPFNVDTLRMLTDSWEQYMLDNWTPEKLKARRDAKKWN